MAIEKCPRCGKELLSYYPSACLSCGYVLGPGDASSSGGICPSCAEEQKMARALRQPVPPMGKFLCNSCDGTGQSRSPGGGVCMWCHGSGWLTCTRCGGTGRA
jgi:hypothetical protein